MTWFPTPPQVATRRDELSDPGIEKLVPIRFVNLLQCAGCADTATLETLQKALHAANDTFKATGLQFAMRSVERHWLSDFVDAGMFRPQWVCNPICTYTVPRRAFSIWFPPDGTWTTLWNPVSSSTPDPSCQWGWGLVDVPLPGVDRNGDGYTDLAVFRAPDYSANAGVFMKASTVGSCTGQQYPNIWPSSLKRPRTRSTVVADMTGDGLPELLFVQPDTMTSTWATSETTYDQLFAVQLGTQRAVFF